MSQPGPLMVVLSGGSGFSPAQVVGLTGWWDASDRATLYTDTGLTTLVANDADAVAAWADKSAQANHMTQPTAGARPLFKVNIVGTKSVVRFDNTDDFISRTTYVGGAIAQPTTHFVAMKVTTTATFQEPMDGVTTRQVVLNGNGTNAGLFAGSVYSSSIPYVTGAAVVMVGIFNGATSKTYVNGGAGEVSNSPGANTMNGVRIGRGADGVNLNGDFYEGLVYSGALSVANINAVGNYLASKWGSTWTTAT